MQCSMCGYYISNRIRKPKTIIRLYFIDMAKFDTLFHFPCHCFAAMTYICLLLNETMHGDRVSYILAALAFGKLWLLSCVQYSKCVCVCVCVHVCWWNDKSHGSRLHLLFSTICCTISNSHFMTISTFYGHLLSLSHCSSPHLAAHRNVSAVVVIFNVSSYLRHMYYRKDRHGRW